MCRFTVLRSFPTLHRMGIRTNPSEKAFSDCDSGSHMVCDDGFTDDTSACGRHANSKTAVASPMTRAEKYPPREWKKPPMDWSPLPLASSSKAQCKIYPPDGAENPRLLREAVRTSKPPNIARDTEIYKLRQFAETCEVRLFSRCRLLTPTLPHGVIYEPRIGWLRVRKDEVLCWLLTIDLRGGKTRERGTVADKQSHQI